MTAIWTESELLDLIKVWKEAYKAAATGKAYTIGARTLTRYNLAEIRATLKDLEEQYEGLFGRRGSLKTVARVWR